VQVATSEEGLSSMELVSCIDVSGSVSYIDVFGLTI
jgi:hypothetical protein